MNPIQHPIETVPMNNKISSNIKLVCILDTNSQIPYVTIDIMIASIYFFCCFNCNPIITVITIPIIIKKLYQIQIILEV